MVFLLYPICTLYSIVKVLFDPRARKRQAGQLKQYQQPKVSQNVIYQLYLTNDFLRHLVDSATTNLQSG